MVATAPSAQAATAPTINLTDPTATVQDPVAGLSPVNTECTAGQVDLNTASVADISAALNLPSTPTVGRLVALRPWLKGSDLSSVPGIGPDVAAAIAARTCATQPTLPASSALACTSSTQVDLQAAAPATIASRLKLPLMTAQALAAARPLPQNLSQVVTPRVPGLSQPTLDKLLRAKSICVTPAPMLAGGSAWRWATPAGGAVVTRDGYSLIVPPGRVITPAGTYISVTPQAPDDGILPRLDGHIWGAWNSGTTTVAVRGPWIGAGEAGMVPVLIHDSADGVTASTGDAVAVGTDNGVPTVTGLVTSLSGVSVGAANCGPTVTGGTFCLNNLLDGSMHDAWLSDATHAANVVNGIDLSAKPSCGTIATSTYSISSLGKLPFGVNCATDGPAADRSATWRMSNDAYGSVLWGIAKLGVLYRYQVHDGARPVQVTGNGADDPILHAAESVLTGAHVPYLFPGQTLNVTKNRDSVDTQVDMQVDPTSTGAWAGVLDALDAVGDLSSTLKDVHVGSLDNMFGDCTHLDANGLGCFKDQIDYYTNLAIQAEKAFEDANPGKRLISQARMAALETAHRAFKWLDVGEWLTNFGFAVGISAGGGTGVLLRNATLVQPPTPGGGSSGGGPLGADDSYIARDPLSPTHRAVLVKPDGTVLNIADGGTFNCLAATWLVWDNAGEPALNKPTAGDATCGDAGSRTWNVQPSAAGGNVPDNVILREYYGDAGSNPQATWLINNNGEIQSIPDGGTYLCLAYANPVIWNVRYANVAAWTPVGTVDASCG